MKRLLFVTGLILALGCTPRHETALTETQKNQVLTEAQQATAAFIDHIEKNDVEGIKASFLNSDHVKLILNDQSFTYTELIKMADEFLPKLEGQEMKIKSESFQVLSPKHFIHFWNGYNAIHYKDGNNESYPDFFMTYVYQKDDDTWKIIHAHESWKANHPQDMENEMPPTESLNEE